MSEFVLHPDAVRDLEEIWEYIAADNLDAADRFREEIYKTIQSLVPFPFVGYSGPDLNRVRCDFRSFTSMSLRTRQMRSRLLCSRFFTRDAIRA